MNHEPSPHPQGVCANIDALAMTYLDGELDGEDLRELEVHLVECMTCRAQVDAEASALGRLRQDLAAPPASDLLRARIARTLDGEDHASIQQWSQRWRSRVGSWMLPSVAVTAAVAALAIFLTANGPVGNGKPVESAAVKQARRARPLEVQGAATNRWVQTHFDPNVEVPTFSDVRVDQWGARLVEVLDRDAVQLFYRVTAAGGRASDVAVVIFDARGLHLSGDQRRIADGRILQVGSFDGASVVSLRDSDDRAYVFTSSHLIPEDLATLVVRSSLLPPIRPRR